MQPPVDGGNPGATTVSPTSPPAATTTSTLLAVVRETGVLQGQGGNKPMVLRFVDSDSSITSVRIGAIVDTAGGSSGGNDSLAPQGIPIGTITGIISQTGDSGSLVEVTPNASLRQLNFVAVVLFLPTER